MKRPLSNGFGAILMIAGLLATPALAEGDVKKGKKVFNKCKSCHFVDKEKNKAGPHLVGVMGRTAGSVEGFKYSNAMKESGIVWSDDTLSQYLAKPKEFMPGNKMVFAGLKKEDQITDLLAYLKEASQKSE